MSKAPASFRIEPRAMKRGPAAAYCGISPGHFDKLVQDGLMPAPRDCRGVKVWLRDELDEALFSLPTHESEAGGSSCDVAFGLST